MDNSQAQADNLSAQNQEGTEQTFRDDLSGDLRNNPSLEKFGNVEDLAKSYLNLESKLGADKIIVPKDSNDTEAWTALNQKLGVPDSAEGYSFSDIDGVPQEALTIDKGAFANVAKKHSLRPDQAEGIWADYNGAIKEALHNINQKDEELVQGVEAELRKEWGNAYDTKVELGERVIEKFANSEEEAKWMQAELGKDPRIARFLANIGSQFSENQIGDFKVKTYTKTPDEALREIQAIEATRGKENEDPYYNESHIDHKERVDYVTNLYRMLNSSKQG